MNICSVFICKPLPHANYMQREEHKMGEGEHGESGWLSGVEGEGEECEGDEEGAEGRLGRPRGRPREGRLPCVERRYWSSLVGRRNRAGTDSPRGTWCTIAAVTHATGTESLYDE